MSKGRSIKEILWKHLLAFVNPEAIEVMKRKRVRPPEYGQLFISKGDMPEASDKPITMRGYEEFDENIKKKAKGSDREVYEISRYFATLLMATTGLEPPRFRYGRAMALAICKDLEASEEEKVLPKEVTVYFKGFEYSVTAEDGKFVVKPKGDYGKGYEKDVEKVLYVYAGFRAACRAYTDSKLSEETFEGFYSDFLATVGEESTVLPENWRSLVKLLDYVVENYSKYGEGGGAEVKERRDEDIEEFLELVV